MNNICVTGRKPTTFSIIFTFHQADFFKLCTMNVILHVVSEYETSKHFQLPVCDLRLQTNYLRWLELVFLGFIRTVKCTVSILFVSTCVHVSVVVETFSETSHLCWNNETIRFKSSLTSIIIESTYLTLNMNKIWGCFKVQVGWKNAFYGETGSRKGLEKVSARPGPWKKHF